jgi:hypothetical protein
MSEVKVNVSLRSTVATGLAEIKGQFKSFGQSVSSSFGAAFAGTFAIGSLVAGLKSIVDYSARIQDLSTRFGVSTDAIQHFGNVAERNGSSLEALTMGFNKLEKARSEVLQKGDKGMSAAFERLGISIKDLQSLHPEELMMKLGASSLDAADTVKILGKNALELRPTLAGIADGTVEMGDAISAIDIQKLKDADTEWKKLFETLRIKGAEVLVSVRDSFKEVGNAISDAASKFRNFITSGALGAKARVGAHGEPGGGWIGTEGSVGNVGVGATKASSKRDFGQEEGDPKKDEARADRLATLRAQLAELQRKASNEQLGTEEKINALIGQRAALLKEAGGEKDEEKQLSLLIDAQRISDEITRAQEHRSGPPKVIADSLARIGGGGRVSATSGGDAHLHEAQKHTGFLKQIAENTSNNGATGGLTLQE